MRVNKYVALTCALALSVAGCTSTAIPDSKGPLGWLEGCWQLDDKSVEETWVQSIQGDQLFGYSVISKDNRRVFFEQLRIDIDGSNATLSASPKGIGPTAFQATLRDTSSIEFANAQNDYPQRIRYERIGDRLVAEISLIDKSKPANWDYRRCN